MNIGSTPTTPGKEAWYDSKPINAPFMEPLCPPDKAPYPWGPRDYKEQDIVLAFKELYSRKGTCRLITMMTGFFFFFKNFKSNEMSCWALSKRRVCVGGGEGDGGR